MTIHSTAFATTVIAACLCASRGLAVEPKPECPSNTLSDCITSSQAWDELGLNIAPFARVVTSDPHRTGGTDATRVQEMPAADIFLDTELNASADGGYVVPVSADGTGCIGLQWYEARSLRGLELHWAPAAALPAADAVQLQYWAAPTPRPGIVWDWNVMQVASPWQGQWKPLPAKFEQSEGVWRWQIADTSHPEDTNRVRWVFPPQKAPIHLKAISALSRSEWTTANLRVELQQPMVGRQAQVAAYNGDLLASAEPSATQTCNWDVSQPLTLRVRYSKPSPQKADRTMLRFELPEKTISVAVEDVVANGCVYVPSAGLFATLTPSQATLTGYLQQIASKKTVIDQVRERPDQTFSEAMAKTHNPAQRQGPMIVSLACDNRKFVANRDGTVCFDLYDAPDGSYPILDDKQCFRLVPQFGGGKGELSRYLDGGWLPKPVASVTENGVKYQQCTYVAPIDEKAPEDCPSWYRQRAVCVAEYTIENTLPTESEASLRLTLFKGGKNVTLDGLQEVADGLIAVSGDRLLAYFDAGGSSPLRLAKLADGVGVTGKLPGGKSVQLTVYQPAWPVKPAEYAILSNAAQWAGQVERYWKDLFARAMQIDIPDPLLANVIRASQVHCMLAARNEDRGRYVAPWIASMAYGPLESESQAVIRGMDMCGHADFARCGLEYFLKRYNAQGYLTTGYTMVGTGEHLWTLAEYQHRGGDREWLRKVAPVLARACKWIVEQRAKTKMLDVRGEKVPEYGLMPAGVTADWNRYGYRFFNDAQYCHGLESVAQELATIGHPDAPSLLADAKQYREDVLRAYHWAQARSPVVALGNGTWVPNHPAMLDIFGNVEEMVSAEDANRSWCYSVELGSHHLAANRLLDPLSAEVTRMMDYLEDHQFLRSGWFDYSDEQNHKDVLNLGGFSKVQPYYARNAEVYALRDDVKPFIRSYFNALSSLLSEETLSLWEHFNNHGVWNKTHETGWFLCQTSTMFAMDRGDELWLAPLVTSRWLEDGKKIEVRNAPTEFGDVSYSISSSSAIGHIDAEIQPPTRNPPKQIVIRIRHPKGKPMKSVTIAGKAHFDFDATAETIRLTPSSSTLRLRVTYE